MVNFGKSLISGTTNQFPGGDLQGDHIMLGTPENLLESSGSHHIGSHLERVLNRVMVLEMVVHLCVDLAFIVFTMVFTCTRRLARHDQIEQENTQ